MFTVLFACVHNAGRSRIAAAVFNALADPARARARSAGTSPAGRVNPVVIEAMREVGIDLSGASPALLTDGLAGAATLLVTMGCGDVCPGVPGLRTEDWPIEDPAGQSLPVVRRIRDVIEERVRALVLREGIGRTISG